MLHSFFIFFLNFVPLYHLGCLYFNAMVHYMSDAVWEITIMRDTLFLIGVVLWYKDVYCVSCVCYICVIGTRWVIFELYNFCTLYVCVCAVIFSAFVQFACSLSLSSPSLFLSLSLSSSCLHSSLI